jgi:ADP-heptose:LPS heptosyltransferase
MNILLVRLRQIGDVIFTTPAVRALRRAFPDARLTYLVEPAAAPVVQCNPHLDSVLIAPLSTGIRRLTDDFHMMRALRRGGFDVAIDFHGGPRAAQLTWLSGAAKRIGYTVPGRGWIYTHRVPRARELRPRHSVRNQWDLLAPLGIGREPDPCRDATEMPPDREAAERVRLLLGAAGVQPGAPLIVVHVSAGNRFRRWPADAFVGLLERLITSDPTRSVILTAGPSDRLAAGAVADRTRQRLGQQGRRILAIRELDLLELHAAIARAALFVGGDSGPLHLASTTTTPVVALFGPTLAARSAPWRDPRHVTELIEPGPLPCRPCDQRQCAPGDFRCLTWLSVEQVAAAAERALTGAHLAA